jgi:S1-C subfamily serine protease
MMTQALAKIISTMSGLALYLRWVLPGFVAFNTMFMPASATPSIREIAEGDLPSVVTVIVHDKAGNAVSLGSGVVVRSGLIVTNVHVVAGAEGVTVFFSDGRAAESPGYAIADTTHDIAVIRADTGRCLALPLAQHDNVHVGDAVVAIGSPEGYAGTVSTGIVSALRSDDSGSVIQITAPISHGSSGGALLNADGEVIGVTFSGVDEGQNLNFAYPVQYVRDAMLKMTAATSSYAGLPEPVDAQDNGSTGSKGSGGEDQPPSDSPDTVWVNTETGIYHRQGSRYYGHTKHGKYMSEKDAVAKGYHPASRG